MSFRFSSEPKNGTELVRAGLAQLTAGPSVPDALRGFDPATLTLDSPHAVYDLRVDELLNGGGLETAQLTCTRYIVRSTSGPVAAAEVRVDSSRSAVLMSGLNFGPFVGAWVRGLSHLASVSGLAQTSFEARFLRCAALMVAAIWLKGGGEKDDLIYRLTPAPDAGHPEKAVPAADFISHLQELAQVRASSRKPGTVS